MLSPAFIVPAFSTGRQGRLQAPHDGLPFNLFPPEGELNLINSRCAIY